MMCTLFVTLSPLGLAKRSFCIYGITHLCTS